MTTFALAGAAESHPKDDRNRSNDLKQNHN